MHWGKLARREIVPPFIPHLYSVNFDQRFLSVPVSLAFNSESLISGNAKESVFISQKSRATNKESQISKHYNSVKANRHTRNMQNNLSTIIKNNLDPLWLG